MFSVMLTHGYLAKRIVALICAMSVALAQTTPSTRTPARPGEPPASSQQAQTPQVPGVPYVRENYSKFEYRIPMRDGVKLFTSVYIPNDMNSSR